MVKDCGSGFVKVNLCNCQGYSLVVKGWMVAAAGPLLDGWSEPIALWDHNRLGSYLTHLNESDRLMLWLSGFR